MYDNSTEAATDGTVPNPILVLEMRDGLVVWPASDDLKELQRSPEWTKSILEAALRTLATRLTACEKSHRPDRVNSGPNMPNDADDRASTALTQRKGHLHHEFIANGSSQSFIMN